MPLRKFQHNIKISIKTARVSRLSVSYDYDLSDSNFSILKCRSIKDIFSIQDIIFAEMLLYISMDFFPGI